MTTTEDTTTADQRYSTVMHQLNSLGTRPSELATELDAIVGERLCEAQELGVGGRVQLDDVIAGCRAQARSWVDAAAGLNRELDKIEAHFDGREAKS